MQKNEIKKLMLYLMATIQDIDDVSLQISSKDCKILLDYITNLQEENEKVHKELDYADNYNIYLISRIDNAIELTENLLKTEDKGYYQILFKKQLEVLQGEDTKESEVK